MLNGEKVVLPYDLNNLHSDLLEVFGGVIVFDVCPPQGSVTHYKEYLNNKGLEPDRWLGLLIIELANEKNTLTEKALLICRPNPEAPTVHDLLFTIALADVFQERQAHFAIKYYPGKTWEDAIAVIYEK